jgi:serine/threonine protein kinase
MTYSLFTLLRPRIQKAEKTIYLVMEFCSGGDLSNYLRMRGKVETLQFSPSPGAPPIYYPHPKSGGLDHKVVKSFLAQLGVYTPSFPPTLWRLIFSLKPMRSSSYENET